MQTEVQHTLAMKVAYRGEAFSGFARQPEQLTVQGELERALEMLLRRPVETTCAGRTDVFLMKDPESPVPVGILIQNPAGIIR